MQIRKGTEVEETTASLRRVEKICKAICLVFKAVLVILCLYWGSAIALMLFSMANQGSLNSLDASAFFAVVLYIAYDMAVAMILVAFIAMFASVSRGESPFAIKQVKRLRLIAAVLLVGGLVETAMSANTAFFQSPSMDAGYLSTNGNAIIPINFGPFVAAAAVFAFSYVFKYGVLLQEFTDETL